MSVRNVVQRVYDDFGRAAGLEKKSGSWYRHGEVIAVSNLQKSQYGRAYYWNQGFAFAELNSERYPAPHKCDVVFRLNDLLPRVDRRIDELLDLEIDIDETSRAAELRSLLDDHLLPIIRRASSVSGVRQMFADGTLRGGGIRGPAQALLFGTTRDDRVSGKT